MTKDQAMAAATAIYVESMFEAQRVGFTHGCDLCYSMVTGDVDDLMEGPAVVMCDIHSRAFRRVRSIIEQATEE